VRRVAVDANVFVSFFIDRNTAQQTAAGRDAKLPNDFHRVESVGGFADDFDLLFVREPIGDVLARQRLVIDDHDSYVLRHAYETARRSPRSRRAVRCRDQRNARRISVKLRESCARVAESDSFSVQADSGAVVANLNPRTRIVFRVVTSANLTPRPPDPSRLRLRTLR
jgi:hypothetical protein